MWFILCSLEIFYGVTFSDIVKLFASSLVPVAVKNRIINLGCPYEEGNVWRFWWSGTVPPSTAYAHCPQEEDIVWRIMWPATASDTTRNVCCPGQGDTPGLGLAHRRCLDGGVWGSVDATQCESVAVRVVRMKVGKIHIEFLFMYNI